MLQIKNLHAATGGTPILKGIDLEIAAGEIHAVMGPNGSGKSTRANALSGRPTTEITEGEIRYEDRDLTEMAPEIRAREGVFLAFQYPVEIPGVPNTTFLKEALNAQRKHRGEEPLDAMEFVKLMRRKTKALGITDDLLKRQVNVGFSGGEKKRNEVLQMAILEPTLAILDETDSGLDIDALKTVSEGINRICDSETGVLLVTHYERILKFVKPGFVHILMDGKVVRSGGPELAEEVDAKGFEWIAESLVPSEAGS